MSEALTRQDLSDLGDRIEHRLDARFDRFETHFDDTMTAIQASLKELHDQVSAERRREMMTVVDAVVELARKTGHLDDVSRILRPLAI